MNINHASNPDALESLRSDGFSIERIKTGIKGSIGRELFLYETVDSTNTIASELAEKGVAEGAVVIADSQVRGRGRLGRSWVSPPGVNVYMSIVLRPDMEPRGATLLTIMASVGCTRALRGATGLDITIKWPNDLVVSEKKLGGILTETRMGQKRIEHAVIGIGININMDSDVLPAVVKEVATSIKMETGRLFSRTEIIKEVLNEINDWYNVLREKRHGELLCQWKQVTSTLGRKVEIVLGNEMLNGLAESITDEGMLIVRLPSGASREIQYGDLTLLR
jgi:BirA family biotin operon repressor/biotin-[acetyl-CoA-carboxylase] ligase